MNFYITSVYTIFKIIFVLFCENIHDLQYIELK